MKIVDISNEIYLSELDEDSSTSISAISQWLRNNVGSLNNLLNKNYYISTTTYEIINSDDGVELGVDESAIFKCLYLRSYLTRKINSNLGAAAIEVSQITQDNITVKSYDKNQVSKTYLELRKENDLNLKTLINNYKYNRGGANPKQITGDDTISKYDVVI